MAHTKSKVEPVAWSEADLIAIRRALVSEFDEDLAQFALLKLLQAQQRSLDIADPFAYCQKVATRRQWREQAKARRFVPLATGDSDEREQVPEGLQDQITPERVAFARELLAHAHPSLIAHALGEKTTASPRKLAYWRKKLRDLANE